MIKYMNIQKILEWIKNKQVSKKTAVFVFIIIWQLTTLLFKIRLDNGQNKILVLIIFTAFTDYDYVSMGLSFVTMTFLLFVHKNKNSSIIA